ncbi:MAG: hypothetical protein H7839_21860 [Magnetococcus sp. YQC-5]
MKRNAFILSLLATLLFCGLCLSQAQAGPTHPPKEIAGLLALWDKLNDRCRGGSGDDQKTWDACDERERTGDQLKARGWCYGEPGQFGYQMEWHKCKP